MPKPTSGSTSLSNPDVPEAGYVRRITLSVYLPTLLAEIGIGGLPDDWPAHAAVYGCSSIDRRHWLLLLPERAQLWLGWSG